MKTHGMKGTRLYTIWQGMKRRCNAPNCKDYKDYGARGITICPEWHDFESFQEWAVNNGYADTLTIDRIDVDGNYEPNNCRWATVKEQANNKRGSLKLYFNGEVHTVREISEMTGISFNSIYYAHQYSGITDFTNYKPHRAEHRNIYVRNDHSFTVHFAKLHRTFNSLEKAIAFRDQLIKGDT